MARPSSDRRRRGNTIGVCTGCGQRAPVRREHRDRCLLRAAVEELADTGDPAAVAALLAPFLEWMATARNPASMLRWMQTPTFWVTRDLINGRIEVSHASLDAVAPRAPQAVGFVRAQLVGCWVLPRPGRAQRRVRRLADQGDRADRARPRPSARARLRHSAGRPPARTHQPGRPPDGLGAEVRALAGQRGDHAHLLAARPAARAARPAPGPARRLDRRRPGSRRRARLFTAWLQRADITGALHVDWPYDFPRRPPLQD
jgi:hypothetical protein